MRAGSGEEEHGRELELELVDARVLDRRLRLRQGDDDARRRRPEQGKEVEGARGGGGAHPGVDRRWGTVVDDKRDGSRG